MLEKFYSNILFKYPKIILGFLLIFTVIIGSFALKLKIDASADSLLLKGDKDLAFTREIAKRFTAPEFLIVTYSSKKSILENNNLTNIIKLSKILKKNIKKIDTITNITNIPLLQSPPKPLASLVDGVLTLLDKNIDKSLVKKEFLTSPIYKDNLVSHDLKTTAIVLNLKKDNTTLSKDILREQNHQNIVKIRKIIKQFSSNHKDITLYLGGTPMIADDLVEFVKHDIKIFGSSIIILLIIILAILFRKIRWVILPLFICTVSIVIASGFLGLFDWQITIISSNFISLQLIMNLSLVVHLIVKYQELQEKNKTHTQKELLLLTVTSMAKPSFFVVLTTVVGFSSLIFSSILPVINFGYMMSFGIIISLITTFILFPLVLSFLNTTEDNKQNSHAKSFTASLPHIIFKYYKTIIAISIILAILAISGAMKLKVENSFIDYFKHNTEIYKGMKLIDQNLGGTTPLDIIITFKDNSNNIKNIDIVSDDDTDMMDEFDDEFSDDKSNEDYWFTPTKMALITKVHNYLEKQNGIGKVLSLATIGKIGKILNNGKDLDGLTLSLLYKKLPSKYKSVILSPYINIEKNQLRVSTRVIDSKKGLNRNKLIKTIRSDLLKIIDKNYATFNITNLLVIYDNLLQSLFQSQIETLGLTVILLFMMFLILFRDFTIATVAMIANIIPVGVIFAFMGYNNIPLDMMTITIAAISMGIAVDDTIHYIHRFNYEMKLHNNIKEAIINSHKSIGKAMFYTSTIIIVGFILLVLSNFIPTIYFGLLIVLAMFMAILADLLLLPALLYLKSKIK